MRVVVEWPPNAAVGTLDDSRSRGAGSRGAYRLAQIRAIIPDLTGKTGDG